MKEDLKNKIQGIKSTVKDAFKKKIDKVGTGQKIDPLVRDKGLTGKNENKAS